jgi:hypothetical protein
MRIKRQKDGRNAMGEMGYGYGSECHLLRWMGRHRHALDKSILDKIKRVDGRIDWMDFAFHPKKAWADAELKGLEFFSEAQWRDLQNEWAKFWVVGSGIHNWDAVGWLHSATGKELLLVEAKANTGEILSDCQATSARSLERITKALVSVQDCLGALSRNDWTKRYYQFANRLATLHFLKIQGVPAHLVYIYFVGDLNGAGRECPQTIAEWGAALQAQAEWINLPNTHPLSDRIHKVFLKVDSELPPP